jgi:phage terminase large subunit-like protein
VARATSRRASGDPLGYIDDARRYADAIVEGRTKASHHAVKACARFVRDYQAAVGGNGPWGYRPDLAARAMLFASQMPNIKGPDAGKPLRLMDWQKFVFANLFGFVERGGTVRRFRQGLVYVPRGNGKTTISAPVALFLTFGEGEGGAEGYAAAVTRDQARILFEVAQNMVRQSPKMQEKWNVNVLANSIYQLRTASRFVPISSDVKALDGLNVQVAVCDEIGSHRTSEVYDVLMTAMGKRLQPFMLAISTATGNNAGIGKQLWDYLMRVLDGAQESERLFGIIYSVDETDDLWDEATWIKANPGWGISVQPNQIRDIMQQARNNPAQENAARTRCLNMWIGADDALFSMRAWNECANHDLRLEDFDGRECHLAVDLASKTDLAALALVFPQPENRYAAFARCYLNEAAVIEARNASYPGWARDGELVVTGGNETDFGQIEREIVDLCKRFRVLSVAYDPWQATQLAQNLTAAGIPVVEFRKITANYTEPTKELDAAMRSRRIEHDGNGPLAWCISNVVGHYDANNNVFPRRPRPENKIDAADALIMGIARAMQRKPKSVYESRGLISFG